MNTQPEIQRGEDLMLQSIGKVEEPVLVLMIRASILLGLAA